MILCASLALNMRKAKLQKRLKKFSNIPIMHMIGTAMMVNQAIRYSMKVSPNWSTTRGVSMTDHDITFWLSSAIQTSRFLDELIRLEFREFHPLSTQGKPTVWY